MWGWRTDQVDGVSVPCAHTQLWDTHLHTPSTCTVHPGTHPHTCIPHGCSHMQFSHRDTLTESELAVHGFNFENL